MEPRRMEWRRVTMFPEYEVSESGDLRRASTGTRLKGHINSDGYPEYQIRDAAGLRTHVSAHRLVAEAFLSPPDRNSMQVAHRDGSRLNAHYTNLRWSTSLENHNDRTFHGNGPRGERNPKAKITARDVPVIRREYREIKKPGSGRCVSELEEKYGLHRATILDIAKGRTWRHIA